MEQVWNVPIRVLSVCDTDGRIEPLRLRLEDGTLRVEGEDLALEEMDAEDLRVTGRIRCVRLEE